MIDAINHHLYTPAATSAAAASSTDFSAQFDALFDPSLRAAAATTPAAPQAGGAAPATPAAQPGGPAEPPTAQSVFGDQPWIQDPQGSGLGATWDYNPIYFATQATAAKVASMVGGTVIEQEVMTPTPGSPLQQSQLNEMVQLPDGTVVNPGLIADFYDHGYSQSFVDQMIHNGIQGV